MMSNLAYPVLILKLHILAVRLQTIQWGIDEKVKKPVEIELKKGYNVYIDKTGKDGYISNEGDLVLERNNED
ncbi:hypothetical protein [Peribacillus frigoritolerans]|uniref:hypothetical protein n=1 Tax=Peribacillus frigoritolerans TaxID=450367 RepID=UPI002B255485|nr:hypothetical protein [Peribacillus frigoritolerans]MEB2630050.1 hypothetical protein [Peribacillus frigoritolerans]